MWHSACGRCDLFLAQKVQITETCSQSEFPCRGNGKDGAEGSVVVAGDAERHAAAHRRTSSRPMEDMSIRRSDSGVAQGDGERLFGSPDNKKDK